MDVKKKIEALKKRSIEFAALVATMLPTQSGLSAPGSDRSIGKDKKISPVEQSFSNNFSDDKVNLINEDITLSIADLKKVLDDDPNIKLPQEFWKSVQPGPSQKKIHSILSKGFHYTIKNSLGETKDVFASLNQDPKGYCAGAIKRLLNKVYKEPISNNLSAYQEKDNLLKSSNFIGFPIELKDVADCPPNTVVVIPKCRGHKHGHIFTVVEKGVYCSDGKEVAGQYFDKNYKDAQGIYAFIPIDGSIKLTPQTLEKSPELCAAILNHSPELYAKFLGSQKGSDFEMISGKNPGEPIMYAEATKAQTNKSLPPLMVQKHIR